MPHFLELLHSEHESVKELFEKIKDTDSGSEKEKIFIKLKLDLEPHMKGEEKYFYPVLLEEQEYREHTLEAIEEHHAAQLILDELDEMSPDREQWHAKVSVLKEMIEHHIEEEEDKIFEDAREGLTDQRMQEIQEQFETEKTRRKGGKYARQRK